MNRKPAICFSVLLTEQVKLCGSFIQPFQSSIIERQKMLTPLCNPEGFSFMQKTDVAVFSLSGCCWVLNEKPWVSASLSFKFCGRHMSEGNICFKQRIRLQAKLVIIALLLLTFFSTVISKLQNEWLCQIYSPHNKPGEWKS